MLFFYLLTRAKFKMASIHSLKKRKLPVIAVATKYNALKEIEGGKSQIETALTYKVSKSTITNWIKKKTQIYDNIFFILFLLTLDIIRYNIDQQLILDLPHYHMYDIELKCPLAPSPYTHKHLTCTQFEKYRYIWSIFSNFG